MNVSFAVKLGEVVLDLIVVTPPSYLNNWKLPSAFPSFGAELSASVTLYCAYNAPTDKPVPPVDGSKL